MSSCSITFHNNPQAVFYGGQVLSGTAVLTTVKQKTIRAIYIEIQGHARVSFAGDDTIENRRTLTNIYTGSEQYLVTKNYVAGNDRSQPFELPPGTYTYDFQTTLPLDIPSTLEGENGYIRYEAALVVDRPWKFDNVFKTRFTVIQTLNLNMDPKYKDPIDSKDVHSVYGGCCCCFCCCGSEDITLKCHIPFSGYAPGQRIPFTITVENEATIDCRRGTIKLQKNMKFLADEPYPEEYESTSIIAEKEFGPIPAITNKEFRDFLQLPPIPPSSTGPERIIHVSYNVMVEVITRGCHLNPTVTFPITIGTVPLLESAEDPSHVAAIPPSAPLLSSDGSSPPPYFANAPPAYEAVTTKEKFMRDDNDKYIEREPFVPKYPVYYNFGLPSAPPGESAEAGMPLLPTMHAMPSHATPSPYGNPTVQSFPATRTTHRRTRSDRCWRTGEDIYDCIVN